MNLGYPRFSSFVLAAAMGGLRSTKDNPFLSFVFHIYGVAGLMLFLNIYIHYC